MFTSSLAALVLAVNVLAPATTVSPMAPAALHKQVDTRVTIKLANNANGFRDVTIAGHVYNIPAHQLLDVKAPVGTAVYAASRTPEFKRGDLMIALTPEMNKTIVSVR